MWISRLEWTATASVTSLWQSCKVKPARPKCCHSLAWKAAALYREDTIAPEVLVAELLVLVAVPWYQLHYFGLSTRSPPPKHVGHRFFHLTAKGFPHHGQITARGQGLLLDYFYNPGLRVVALGKLFSSLVAPCGQRASVKDVYQRHQTVISNLERGHHAQGKQTWWSYKTFRTKKIISYKNEIRTLWLVGWTTDQRCLILQKSALLVTESRLALGSFGCLFVCLLPMVTRQFIMPKWPHTRKWLLITP